MRRSVKVSFHQEVVQDEVPSESGGNREVPPVGMRFHQEVSGDEVSPEGQ